MRGISQSELLYLSRCEPADGVVLMRLHVRHLTPPAARGPYSEIQAGLRIDPAQDRAAVNALKLHSELFGHFPPERIPRIFARLDMPAGEVPHVRIRQPCRRPATKQRFLRPQQDHGHDVMVHPSSVTRNQGEGCQSRPCHPWRLKKSRSAAGLAVSRQANPQNVRQSAVPSACTRKPSDTLTARANLASWAGEAGDAAGARDQLDALLPVLERVQDPEHPNTLAIRHQLASWTGEAGDVAGARDQFDALLLVLERVQGSEHPDTLAARHQLASWMGQVGDAVGARDQFAALLPVRERVQDPEHPNTLATRANLAYWTGKVGDLTAARDQFAALVILLEEVQGPKHPETLNARHNLAYLTRQIGGAGPSAG